MNIRKYNRSFRFTALQSVFEYMEIVEVAIGNRPEVPTEIPDFLGLELLFPKLFYIYYAREPEFSPAHFKPCYTKQSLLRAFISVVESKIRFINEKMKHIFFKKFI